MSNRDLIGRYVYTESYERLSSIYQIVMVLKPHHGMKDMGERLRMRDLSNGKEEDFHWAREVGTHYHLIKRGYPLDDLEFLARWVDDSGRAANIEADLMVPIS